MYLGRIVELADKAQLFARPRHPYTRMLLDAIPDIHMSGRSRTPVQGEVPNPLEPAAGLHLPSALPACQRALPRRAAEAARDRRRPRRLPRRRGRADLSAQAGVGAPASSSRCSPRMQVGERLALADEPRLAARHHHLGGARPRCCSCSPCSWRRRRRRGRRRSRRARRASARSRPSQSPDSQIGPTTSQRDGRRLRRARTRRCASRRRTSPAASGRSSPRRRCRSCARRRASGRALR